jgi:hypothetical protein
MLAQISLHLCHLPSRFSIGRLQVNHLQHDISSQSFKALVVLGSWYDTPLMPKDLKAATASVESQKDRKGKSKASDDIIVVDDSLSMNI